MTLFVAMNFGFNFAFPPCFRVYLFEILWRVLLRLSDLRFRVWSRGLPFEAGHRAALPSDDSGRGGGWSVGLGVWDGQVLGVKSGVSSG